jgi:hypothetical protein
MLFIPFANTTISPYLALLSRLRHSAAACDLPLNTPVKYEMSPRGLQGASTDK